jgi:peptide/nickel transport system ATP-binding protein
VPVLRKRTLEQNRRVQYVWQEVRGSFDERRPVDEQVARTAVRLRGLSAEKARAEAVATLARLGVSAMVAARPPSRLSGGELQRAALVWISHDLGLVAAVSDHVLVLDASRVVEEGPPAAVMTEPRTDLTRRLVRAARVGRPTEEPAPPPVLTSSADTRSDPR